MNHKSYSSYDVITKAAALLRLVAEGKSAPAQYFWCIVKATEALRDGNPTDVDMYMRHSESPENQSGPAYSSTRED